MIHKPHQHPLPTVLAQHRSRPFPRRVEGGPLAARFHLSLVVHPSRSIGSVLLVFAGVQAVQVQRRTSGMRGATEGDFRSGERTVLEGSFRRLRRKL